MHKNPKFGWGSLQRSQDPLAGFKGPTSKRRGGEGTGESVVESKNP